ncbi:MAG: class 1 isoprenoid biosynthesis enzyme [Paludibacter sp.]|jgi:hypothetical protein|nr:class 1 isoprenoid biosynthesis enzyme [Paludibacter sp.]
MTNYINNLIQLPGLFFNLIQKLYHQRSFIRETLAIDIEYSKKANDGSLADKDYKKIVRYYGYAVPAIVGESLCILRGRKMSRKERTAITYVGALSGLFDDLIDKKELAENYIKELIEHPYDHTGNDAHEKLFLNFGRKVLENSADTALIKEYYLNVFDAQILSKKQKLQETSVKEIEDITYLKGGCSFLFYCSIFGPVQNEKENRMIYKLGALMQLENDIFDIYKDNRDGIRTLATCEKSMKHLREVYQQLMDEIFQLAQQTGYHRKNIRAFLRIVAAVICRGFVCLDRLEKNEKSTNNTFSLSEYSRKDLICDMEKPVNFLRTIDYYARCNFNQYI